MKDKLTKNGHKKGYYRLKTFVFALAVVLSMGALLSIPVAVTYNATISMKNDAKNTLVESGEKDLQNVKTFTVLEF